MKKKKSLRQFNPYVISYKKSGGAKNTVIICLLIISLTVVVALNFNSIFRITETPVSALADDSGVQSPAGGEPRTLSAIDSLAAGRRIGKLPDEAQPEATDPVNVGFGTELFSSHAGLFYAEDLGVIADMGIDEQIFPASMTKILSVVMFLEYLDDMEEIITLNPAMFDALAAADASTAGFLPGEEVRVIDLLYGAFLPSGAECCVALAERIAGSEEAFAMLMNDKAAELGLNGSHFTNTTGLPDPEHYSTVRDIAKILRYAVKNEDFRKIFTAKRYSTAITNKHTKGITVRSTLFSALDGTVFGGCEILGGKTGYTDAAGLCLASLAVLDGKEYILVTGGAPRVPKTDGEPDPEPLSITDAKAVYSGLAEMLKR